jgi:4-diphosphocytidyl-2-C-methyl-D-erythritol kinase
VIAPAPAKINLALVVGPLRDDRHELHTIYQRIDLCDRISVEPAASTTVAGFADDTIVRAALEALAAPVGWRVRIEKHIPLTAGLGGGSSDAATALRLANEQLADPRPLEDLHAIAAELGADVPFFLYDGPQLGTGDGTTVEPIDLPQTFSVLVLLPHGASKASTGKVYAAFDRRGGEEGYDERVESLRDAVASVRETRDLARLPRNDLASSSHADALLRAGAFRADVSGAGPTLYGLFEGHEQALRAARNLGRLGRVWVTYPAWYG